MADEKQTSSPVGVGVMTILTVLVVLILAVFAALSLSAARGDRDASRSAAEFTTAYYAADARACEAAAEFGAGAGTELERTFPVTERQELYIHLVREDGAVRALSWRTRPVPEEIGPEEPMPVWDGTTVPEAGG